MEGVGAPQAGRPRPRDVRGAPRPAAGRAPRRRCAAGVGAAAAAARARLEGIPWVVQRPADVPPPGRGHRARGHGVVPPVEQEGPPGAGAAPSRRRHGRLCGRAGPSELGRRRRRWWRQWARGAGGAARGRGARRGVGGAVGRVGQRLGTVGPGAGRGRDPALLCAVGGAVARACHLGGVTVHRCARDPPAAPAPRRRHRATAVEGAGVLAGPGERLGPPARRPPLPDGARAPAAGRRRPAPPDQGVGAGPGRCAGRARSLVLLAGRPVRPPAHRPDRPGAGSTCPGENGRAAAQVGRQAPAPAAGGW